MTTSAAPARRGMARSYAAAGHRAMPLDSGQYELLVAGSKWQIRRCRSPFGRSRVAGAARQVAVAVGSYGTPRPLRALLASDVSPVSSSHMEFAKLHGTGNDFVVIDARELDRDWRALAQRMCDRHFGVGADGLILATESTVAPVRMRIFNADGSEAEMSGNGL